MNKALVGALFAASFATAACSSTSREARLRNPAPCPIVVVISDAARLLEFEGEEKTIDALAYSGEIVDVATTCRYFADKPIDVDVTVSLAFGKGPLGQPGDKVYKYFVAVTRKDQEVISKREFAVLASFDDDERIDIAREEVDRISIPRLSDETSGLNFEIVVGFVVTPEQAIFNRSGASLKFPNLK